MRRTGHILTVLLLCLGCLTAAAQAYVAPEVKHSKDKVRVAGKVYWSHVVTEKQTLWSICKAYEVELSDIYEANPTLNLPQEGLKTGQILMIPVRKSRPAADRREQAPAPQPAPPAAPASAAAPEPAPADNAATQVEKKALFPWHRQADTAAVAPVAPADTLAAPADTLAAPEDTVFIPDIPERIALGLFLPLRGNRTDGNLSFYSGALMAARELGNRGIRIDLTLEDLSDSLSHKRHETDFDVILGPVSDRDIKAAIDILPEGKHIISPLDPKVAPMADSCRVIQAPTPWQEQIKALVAWAAEETGPRDSVVLVKESDTVPGEDSAFLIAELNRAGIRYKTISYGILQGLGMGETFENCASREGTTRYFIASGNEAFVGDVIRNANLMAYKEYDVTVYCPSKVRSFDLIDVETFHNVSLRLATTYFTDYTDPAVKAFVMAYRALFKAEPDSYAFQGYDTTMYFVQACATWGRKWFFKLPEFSARGLHTDFRFDKADGPGQTNRAIRRVIYNKDFSMTVL